MLGISLLLRFLHLVCNPVSRRAPFRFKEHTPNPITEPTSPNWEPPIMAHEEIPIPDAHLLNEHFLLGEILDHIGLFRDAFPYIDIPALTAQINNIRNHNVDPERHLRTLLRVFEKTDVFQAAFAELDGNTKRQVRAFLDGEKEQRWLNTTHHTDKTDVKAKTPSIFQIQPSPAVKRHFTELADDIHEIFHPSHKIKASDGGELDSSSTASTLVATLPEIWEDEGKQRRMEVHARAPFHNWGLSVNNTPIYTFVPRTVLGLSNLVVYAKSQKLRVRVGGYRHSWSSSFSQDDHILVSLLNLEEVTKIPDPMSISAEYIDPSNELKVIQIVPPESYGEMKVQQHQGLVRVGVSVTNEQFRRWAVANDRWSLPMDVILVEVTIGGVNGPICHGAGRAHPTMSDLVRAIEYIDANGVPRKITNPKHLRAAAGSFGLLGIVTHVTLAVDPMSYAILSPTKPPVGLAVPPLRPEHVPMALRKTWLASQVAQASKDFEYAVTNAYYSEYFWFTYQKTAWVNVWNTTSDKTDVVEYPSPFDTWLQWVEGWLGGIISSSAFFKALPGRWQAQLLATSSMVALPPFSFSVTGSQAHSAPIKTALPNALHFRRGIQNMRVRDMEFQIPIPYKRDGTTPDLSIVQRAWWDIINLVYSDDGDNHAETPMRLTLEMRIMAGSDIIMAPQHGNGWGTCSIEVLSLPDAVDDGVWTSFCQQVADIWMGYTDEAGVLLNVRPHWAKEWEHIHMRGVPAREYLREQAYKQPIREFRSVLADVGDEQGWSLGDLKDRFSNELWDDIVFSSVADESLPTTPGLVVSGQGREVSESGSSGSDAGSSDDGRAGVMSVGQHKIVAEKSGKVEIEISPIEI